MILTSYGDYLSWELYKLEFPLKELKMYTSYSLPHTESSTEATVDWQKAEGYHCQEGDYGNVWHRPLRRRW